MTKHAKTNGAWWDSHERLAWIFSHVVDHGDWALTVLLFLFFLAAAS
jgi:hypothetical protein